LKDEKDRKQMSFLEGEQYDYFFFVTNKSGFSSEEKYTFLAGKITQMARNVIMKISEKYPYREIYEQNLP
jgi:hypothetical protein